MLSVRFMNKVAICAIIMIEYLRYASKKKKDSMRARCLFPIHYSRAPVGKEGQPGVSTN